MLPVSALRERCGSLERELLAQKTTPAVIDDIRPGGASNPATDAYAWLKFLQRLVALHAGTGSGTAPAKANDAEIEDVLADALADEPESVTCADGSTHLVYPKSYHALRFMDFLDARLQLATSAAQAIAAAGSSREGARAPLFAPLVESLTVRTWLWILTTPGPALPFDDGQEDPQPPAWTTQIAPEDLVRFLRAHHSVNARRLAFLSRAFPPDSASGDGRLSIAGFLGSFARETGRKPRDLMRRTTLGSLFASAVTAADAHKRARDAARKERA